MTRPATAAKILILLPSLALLRQTLHEWMRETLMPSLAYLCACSDPTVKEGIDALATQQSDLDFQVATDAASVRSFLDAPFAGVKMIFAIYQSASMAGAARQPGEVFDFAVFDEAHKSAGREGRNFAFALDEKLFPPANVSCSPSARKESARSFMVGQASSRRVQAASLPQVPKLRARMPA